MNREYKRCTLPKAYALFITAGLSILTELIVYHPLYKRKASLNVTMIASIGIMTILINVVALIFGNETKVLDSGTQQIFTFGELIINTPQMLQAGIGIVLIGIFFAFLGFGNFGLKIRALSNDNALFKISGFNVKATRLIVFALSGVFLSAGSCLTAYDIGMSPQVGMSVLINAMVAMIIGGIGRFRACLIGGLLLGVLQALVAFQFSPNWQNAITFFVLLLFLFFRPRGIFGYKRRVV
jgi:branched-chain amino acid transport system permease protein